MIPLGQLLGLKNSKNTASIAIVLETGTSMQNAITAMKKRVDDLAAEIDDHELSVTLAVCTDGTEQLVGTFENSALLQKMISQLTVDANSNGANGTKCLSALLHILRASAYNTDICLITNKSARNSHLMANILSSAREKSVTISVIVPGAVMPSSTSGGIATLSTQLKTVTIATGGLYLASVNNADQLYQDQLANSGQSWQYLFRQTSVSAGEHEIPIFVDKSIKRIEVLVTGNQASAVKVSATMPSQLGRRINFHTVVSSDNVQLLVDSPIIIDVGEWEMIVSNPTGGAVSVTVRVVSKLLYELEWHEKNDLANFLVDQRRPVAGVMYNLLLDCPDCRKASTVLLELDY